MPVALDIADRAAVLAALGAIEADVLVNNASPLVRSAPPGRRHPRTSTRCSTSTSAASLNCLAATVPGMKARGRGHIVNLGSMAGTWIFPGMPVYAMTKAAIHSLSQTLAARPARQRRAGERDRARPGRDRRASRLAGGPRGGPPAASTKASRCLQPDDIAEAIMFVLGAPQRMDVSYMEIVPTDQSYGGSQFLRRDPP